mmetsp:Transcript_6527/g.24509  ORF Transcript_6527/g.24509 Transcript_6527/m.24509 type:complete len:352 (+) Transcript_6527:525-1580(+)
MPSHSLKSPRYFLLVALCIVFVLLPHKILSQDDPPCGSDPACQMGAPCQDTPVGPKCNCDLAFPGWNDQSCSYMDCRVNQDFSVDERRSSRMLQLPYNRVNNTCECPPGWTGAYCKMCTTDEGCNTRYADWLTDKNGTMRCDTSMAMWNTVNSNMFNCLITDEVIISLVGGKVKMSGTCQGVALDRNNTNPEDSTCLVVGFSDIGYPPPDGAAMSQYMLDKTNELNLGALDQGESGELVAQLPDFANDPKIPPGYLTSIFYCYLHDCEETISDDHKTVVYSCKQTKCRATDHYPVSMGFKILLAGAKTYSAWTCNEETKVCLLFQEELVTIHQLQKIGSQKLSWNAETQNE